MKSLLRPSILLALAMLVVVTIASAQKKISIGAGTPEDQALQAISAEADAQKRVAMLQDFLEKFSSNPDAAAYGNWQLAQEAVTAGDAQTALAYGDKALAVMPDVVDILMTQVDAAQRAKNAGKVVDYAVRGATLINEVGKKPRPEGIGEQEFATQIAAEKKALEPNYQYFEAGAYNAITGETDPRKRMQEIERFLGTFSSSSFAGQVASLAIVTLQELKDAAGLASFGDKLAARNPADMRLMTLLANAYASEPSAAHMEKAGAYARKAIELQKSQSDPAAAHTMAGLAHSVLGRVLLQEKKFPAAVAELKAANEMLADSPEDHAGSLFYLGFAYAKMERANDAIAALTKAAAIPGAYQQPAQDLLAKIKAARSRAH
ncbi:MAG: hypothetical protein ACR2IF_16255 [Terriglobales bacterium]